MVIHRMLVQENNELRSRGELGCSPEVLLVMVSGSAPRHTHTQHRAWHRLSQRATVPTASRGARGRGTSSPCMSYNCARIAEQLPPCMHPVHILSARAISSCMRPTHRRSAAPYWAADPTPNSPLRSASNLFSSASPGPAPSTSAAAAAAAARDVPIAFRGAALPREDDVTTQHDVTTPMVSRLVWGGEEKALLAGGRERESCNMRG